MNLTDEQKREAINLAMGVECGVIEAADVLDAFEANPDIGKKVLKFWFAFNDMTRSAIQVLLIERCKMHLERCWEIDE